MFPKLVFGARNGQSYSITQLLLVTINLKSYFPIFILFETQMIYHLIMTFYSYYFRWAPQHSRFNSVHLQIKQQCVACALLYLKMMYTIICFCLQIVSDLADKRLEQSLWPEAIGKQPALITK